MSAANRGAKRTVADFYPTPESAFKPLLWWVAAVSRSDECVWEPACGDGRLIQWLQDAGIPAMGNDLVTGYNFLADKTRRWCVATNPSFSLAQEFICHALELAPHVFMLLRLNFLGGQCRREWWKLREPNALFVLSERPSFAWKCILCDSMVPNNESQCACGSSQGAGKKSTDATDYAWFYWGTAHSGVYHL